jgi:nicotinate phosphoribosyltransferase
MFILISAYVKLFDDFNLTFKRIYIMPKRLDPHVFDLPVQELRRGYLSDIYFWREKITLEHHNLHPQVTMQVFQKKDAVLCGVDEAVAVLKLAAGRYTDYTNVHQRI